MKLKNNFQSSVKTPKQTALSVLLLTAVVFLSGCGERTVANASSEFEANLMFDILHSYNLRVDKKQAAEADVKTWEITVDEGWFGDGEAAAAIQILRDSGLPRPLEPEIKSDSSALGIVSEREEKERQRRDLQIQIEHQLYTLPDVTRASVIITQPNDDILDLEKTPPSASVSLVLKETQPKFTIEAVQTLVSASISSKLKPENVKVIVSQQSPREFPLEKLAAKRRSNQILAIGGSVVALLAIALGSVLYMSKRRKNPGGGGDETERLSEGENGEEFDGYERPLLRDGDEGEDEDR